MTAIKDAEGFLSHLIAHASEGFHLETTHEGESKRIRYTPAGKEESAEPVEFSVSYQDLGRATEDMLNGFRTNEAGTLRRIFGDREPPKLARIHATLILNHEARQARNAGATLAT